MNLGIVGSRVFKDNETAKSLVFPRIKFWADMRGATTIVSGGADGPDKCAEEAADKLGLEKRIILPDWNKFGRKAGFVRNELIVKESDMVLCFWDGKSHGTKNDIELCAKFGKEVKVYIWDGEDWQDNAIITWGLYNLTNLWKKYKREDLYLVRVCNTAKRFDHLFDCLWEDVYPGDLAWKYKDGRVTLSTYFDEYWINLDIAEEVILEDWKQIKEAAGGRTVVLLCWEVNEADCHRGVLLHWLQSKER